MATWKRLTRDNAETPHVARHRDQAAVVFESVAEEWLRFDGLGTGIEGRCPQFRERPVPPVRDEAPAHGNERAGAVPADDPIDGRCGHTL